MGILSDFERRLEGAIEGVFAKAFRTGLHPVELATRILREMDSGKTVGVRNVWVPNHFVFHLSPEDMERFEETKKALARELEQVVRDGARERGWGLVGPASVSLETGEELKRGKFECEASLVEGPSSAGLGEGPRATGGGAVAIAESAAPVAEIVVIEDGAAMATFDLSKDRSVVGRLPESEVVVADPGASRRHAEIRREGDDFVLVDLGSTNGTMVNEATIGEHVLQDGDRITIGKTVLEFRRR